MRWHTIDGRHPSRTFTLKADAERFLRQTIVDKERYGLDVGRRDETLRSVIKLWWPSTERSVKPRTAERYAQHLKWIEEHPIADLPLTRLDFDAVQGFIDDLAPRLSPKTISGTYGVLNLILAAAAKRRMLAKRIDKPALPRAKKPPLVIPTRHEVEALAEASDARLHVPILLAGYCGLREGELLALHRADVHLDKHLVFVHQARNKTSGALESTKTDRSRNVYLPTRVLDALREHLEEYPDDVLVVPVSASVLQKSWEVARARCGLQRVRFHDLRHAAASMMIAAGLSVAQVSEQLGHANATMTLNTYAHLWPHSFTEAIQRMDAYLGQD